MLDLQNAQNSNLTIEVNYPNACKLGGVTGYETPENLKKRNLLG